MNPFVAATQLLGYLAGLGQEFAFANDPKFTNGEYFVGTVTSMGADSGALTLWARNQLALRAIAQQGPDLIELDHWSAKVSGDLTPDDSAVISQVQQDHARAAAQGASIIALAMAIVDGLDLSTGFGPPEESDALRSGSQQFTVLGGRLGSAVVDSGWQGTASQAYADGKAALEELALAFAERDVELAALVKNYAVWVTHVRLAFGFLKELLAAALVIELAIRSAPAPLGALTALRFAIVTSALGIQAAVAMLIRLVCFSTDYADQADALTTRYSQSFARAVIPGGLGPTRLAASTPSLAVSVEGIPGSLQGYRVGLSAAIAGDQAPPDATSAALQPASETTVFAPVADMPTLAQVRTWAKRVATVSGKLFQPAGLAYRGMGQPEPPTVASAEPDLTNDGAGAAAGERTPLTAVGAQPLPQSALAGQF